MLILISILYSACRVAFDARSLFSFLGNGGFDRNVIKFGTDNSSSEHAHTRK